jgi:uncharacterized RmlC-like cupin family protein
VSEKNEELYEGGIRLVRGADLSQETGQTTGAQRLVAVGPNDDATARSSRIWMGRVSNEPGMRSVPHHHGEAETAGYILSGNARIYWGEGYEQYVDLETGDFCYVPAYLPHIEANLSDTDPLVFLTCRTPDNIVVNLEDVDVDPDAV